MRRNLIVVVGALLGACALSLLAPARVWAFCRTTTCGDTCNPPDADCVTNQLPNIPLFWADSCVSYDLQQDASKWASLDVATTIVDTVFATWTGVTCDGQPLSITSMNRGPVVCAAREFNDGQKTAGGNANIIVFRDDTWPESAVSDPTSTLALTTVTYNKTNGQIVDADIEINGSQAPLSTDDAGGGTAFDLQSILTHETGHFFGMAHSTVTCMTDGSDCPSMNAHYRPGSIAYRTLEDDDKAGICAIYPPGRAATDNSCLPIDGFSAVCGHKPDSPQGGCALAGGGSDRRGGGLATLLVMTLALSLARSRRACKAAVKRL
ncbi:MAG TPA: matrixin family metalloprotease [Polyangia bacterium]|jgi:hypothetical protein